MEIVPAIHSIQELGKSIWQMGKFKGILLFIFLFLSMFFSSCTKIPKEDGSWVSSIIHERIDKKVHWYQGNQSDLLVREKIRELLEKDLSVDESVQIALLNNPSLQATFEEIGIAQADLVEAGLFTNPLFDGYARWPDLKCASFNAAFTITATFIDLFLVPLRKKTAALQFEQTKMNVSNDIMELALDVEITFYSLQAAIKRSQLQQTLIDITQAAAGIAQKQYDAGNINILIVQKKISDLQQAKLELEHIEIEMISLREKLSILMGIKYDILNIGSELLQLPESEVSLEDLETKALSERFDVSATKKEIESIASLGAQKQWWTYTDGQIGFSWEQEADHIREMGPAFRFFIPIFNYGQADRARLFAQLRQSQSKLKALEIEVRAQVKAAGKKILENRRIAECYASCILPLRGKIINSAQKQYNVMTYGVYDLLKNKREEVQAHMKYENALRDYWIERVKLDYIVGGKLK